MVLGRSEDPIPSFSLNLIAGPPLVALCLNWALLGVLCTQVYIYSVSFPKDRPLYKVLVYSVLLLDLAQTIMLMSDGFGYYVYGWGNPASWNRIGLSWFSTPILDGILGAIVQMTFAWRLWILAKSRILSTTVAVLSLLQLATSLAEGIKFKLLSGISDQIETRTTIIVWLVSSVVVDMVIAVSMTILLFRSKGPVGHTNKMINRLILLTLETGILTASVSIVSLILFFAVPNSLLYVCPAIVLGKLYSNTLLVIFNNRIFVRQSQSFHSSSFAALQSEPSPLSMRADEEHSTNISHGPVRVDIYQETVTVTDSIALGDLKKQKHEYVSDTAA